VRCADTLAPYAAGAGRRLVTRDSLSEEGYAANPEKAPRQLARLLERGEPAALCSHGPVLPTLVNALLERVEAGHSRGEWVAKELRNAVDGNLGKGEVFVVHLAGRGAEARVVGAERIDT
jgi:8-oxo-dGTP diphosphatase